MIESRMKVLKTNHTVMRFSQLSLLPRGSRFTMERRPILAGGAEYDNVIWSRKTGIGNPLSYGYRVSGGPFVQNAGFVFEYMRAPSRDIAIFTGFGDEWWQLY